MTSLAEGCPDLPDCVIARLLESWEIPCKTNYRICKKFETAETGNLFKNDITFWKDLSLSCPTSSLNICEYAKFPHLLDSYRNQ